MLRYDANGNPKDMGLLQQGDSTPRCEAKPITDHNESASHESNRRLEEALRRLLEAKKYAEDLGLSAWDFAVELRELRKLQLTTSDLRWLILKGYVERASETTLPGEEHRTFRPIQGLTFTKRSCFVITPAGISAMGIDSSDHVAHGPPASHARPMSFDRVNPTPTQKVVPHWDSDLQELRINGLIVKQFKVPAPNQEMVLAAFEEEHWPARIDDPLPPQADQDPKRRLHDTIVSLNRSHKHRMLRFMGDGSGEGVRWTLVKDEIGDETSAAGEGRKEDR